MPSCKAWHSVSSHGVFSSALDNKIVTANKMRYDRTFWEQAILTLLAVSRESLAGSIFLSGWCRNESSCVSSHQPRQNIRVSSHLRVTHRHHAPIESGREKWENETWTTQQGKWKMWNGRGRRGKGLSWGKG